jgi:outer membrane receptor protein involved in Fe transport
MLWLCPSARADDGADAGVADAAPPTDSAPANVEVITIYELRPAEAASSVHLDAQQLAERPHTTASDLLRQVPGLVVAQHAGGGKADQLFLRGFDADHGTDVALFVDGVPANMPSHAHGQGYADTHWLIPDLVKQIDVHKGPYSARFGDFYTAGAAEFRTLDEVPGLVLQVTGGTELDGPAAWSDPTLRLFVAASPRLPTGTALVAGELWSSDGPFVNPQDFKRGNLFGKWKTALAGGELTLLATMYAARWNASGQIPARAVAAGTLDRFGSIDPTEGGDSSRASISASWEGAGLHVRGYVVDYRLRLFSDFTFFARDPVNGDEIEQTDARAIYGIAASYTFAHARGVFTAGVQGRADNVDAELWHDARRVRLADCFDAGANPCSSTTARIRNLSMYAEDDVLPWPWLEVIGGLRYDLFVWDVDDLNPRTRATPGTAGGFAQAGIVSPKLSLIARPDPALDLFVNGGFGFHSNDARAAVKAPDGALARASGAEVGARIHPWASFEASAAFWYLYLSSEQVWNGDEGGTEAAGATQRYGADLDFVWSPWSWLTVDANLELAHASFVANAGNGGAVALAPRIMGGGGVTLREGQASVALRARGIGPRPANEEDTLTADGYLVLDLIASYAIGPWRFGLTVDNVLDSPWREAQFAETSRLRGEATAVEDIHFTPGTPLVALFAIGFTIR